MMYYVCYVIALPVEVIAEGEALLAGHITADASGAVEAFLGLGVT